MKIKICGLNPTRDVQLCVDQNVDYLGFVFYEKSPRNINPADIQKLSRYDKKNSAFVAVTVNPKNEFIEKNLVSHQARLAKKAGLDALVCSPHEVNDVRKIFKKEIITPGVQIGKRNYDQKRSMEAKKVQSDWLVIGRAITRGNIKKNIQNLSKELK